MYDDNKKEIDIGINDLNGLIKLKNKINLNFDNYLYNDLKKGLIEIKSKLEKFIDYVERIQNIVKYFKDWNI